MASGFQDTNRALSRLLVEQARAIGVFDHPVAKGDGREDLLRRFLADRVGSTFGVTKAEVVDSNAKSTGELDIVIYDQSVASCLTVLGERRIVRVEAVAVTIEVKSRFEPSTWVAEMNRVREGIGALTRFYRPGPLLATLLRGAHPDLRAAKEVPFLTGLSTLDDFEEMPAVVSAYFGFDGPSEEQAQKFIEGPLLDALCVLGKYTIAKKAVGYHKRANGTEEARAWMWGRGDDALGAFLQILEGALGNFLDARSLVLPAAGYYKPEAVPDLSAPRVSDGGVPQSKKPNVE